MSMNRRSMLGATLAAPLAAPIAAKAAADMAMTSAPRDLSMKIARSYATQGLRETCGVESSATVPDEDMVRYRVASELEDQAHNRTSPLGMYHLDVDLQVMKSPSLYWRNHIQQERSKRQSLRVTEIYKLARRIRNAPLAEAMSLAGELWNKTQLKMQERE